MNPETNIPTRDRVKPIAVVLACLLIIGAFGDDLPYAVFRGNLPYAYYDFLRLAVTAGAGFIAVTLWQRSQVLRSIGFFAIALTFNPFIPLEMRQHEWANVDIAAAIFIVVAVFRARDAGNGILALGWRKLAGASAVALACVGVALFHDSKLFWGLALSALVLAGLPLASIQNIRERPKGLLPGSVTLRDWDRREKRGNRWQLIWGVSFMLLVGAWAMLGPSL